MKRTMESMGQGLSLAKTGGMIPEASTCMRSQKLVFLGVQLIQLQSTLLKSV